MLAAGLLLLAASGCATTRASDGSKAIAIEPPPASLSHPFAYFGHDTRPGVLSIVSALDADRIPPEDSPTSGVGLWFQAEVTPKQREQIDRMRPRGLEGTVTWGSHFVYVSVPADAIEDPDRDALARSLDAWVMATHELAPLVFAIREGTGRSTDHESWHRRSLMAAPEYVFPAIDRWLADHPPGTAGPEGVAMARLVRTLLRFLDAHQAQWIRAYGDDRWMHFIDRSLGHDLVADLENATVQPDAALPGERTQESRLNTVAHVALTAGGRPLMGKHANANLLRVLHEESRFPDPWLGEAVGRMARGAAEGRGPEAAAMLAQHCLRIAECPASTAIAGVGWWIDAGKLEEAAGDLRAARSRWPDEQTEWERLCGRLERASTPEGP